MLTGAVLSKLPHPNGFGLGFRSTLQGAHAEKSDSGTLVICIKHNQHFTQTPLFSTKREQGEHLSFAPGRAGCGAFGLPPDVKYSLMSEGFQSLNSSGTWVSFRTLSMTCSLSSGCKVFKNLRACSLDHLYSPMNIRCENHAVDDWESMLMQQIGVQPVGLSPRKKKLDVCARSYFQAFNMLSSKHGQKSLNMGFPRLNILSCLPPNFSLQYPCYISVHSLN